MLEARNLGPLATALIVAATCVGPADALGYEDFTLNWLEDGRLVSMRMTNEHEVHYTPENRGVLGVDAEFANASRKAGRCDVSFQQSIRCDHRRGMLAGAGYRWIPAREFDRGGYALLKGEPSRIYRQFRTVHKGKGGADGHFECVAGCRPGVPRFVVLVWLGD